MALAKFIFFILPLLLTNACVRAVPLRSIFTRVIGPVTQSTTAPVPFNLAVDNDIQGISLIAPTNADDHGHVMASPMESMESLVDEVSGDPVSIWTLTPSATPFPSVTMEPSMSSSFNSSITMTIIPSASLSPIVSPSTSMLSPTQTSTAISIPSESAGVSQTAFPTSTTALEIEGEIMHSTEPLADLSEEEAMPGVLATSRPLTSSSTSAEISPISLSPSTPVQSSPSTPLETVSASPLSTPIIDMETDDEVMATDDLLSNLTDDDALTDTLETSVPSVSSSMSVTVLATSSPTSSATTISSATSTPSSSPMSSTTSASSSTPTPSESLSALPSFSLLTIPPPSAPMMTMGADDEWMPTTEPLSAEDPVSSVWETAIPSISSNAYVDISPTSSSTSVLTASTTPSVSSTPSSSPTSSSNPMPSSTPTASMSTPSPPSSSALVSPSPLGPTMATDLGDDIAVTTEPFSDLSDDVMPSVWATAAMIPQASSSTSTLATALTPEATSALSATSTPSTTQTSTSTSPASSTPMPSGSTSTSPSPSSIPVMSTEVYEETMQTTEAVLGLSVEDAMPSVWVTVEPSVSPSISATMSPTSSSTSTPSTTPTPSNTSSTSPTQTPSSTATSSASISASPSITSTTTMEMSQEIMEPVQPSPSKDSMSSVTTTAEPSLTSEEWSEYRSGPNTLMSCMCIEAGNECSSEMAEKSKVCSANTPRLSQSPTCNWTCCMLCMVHGEVESCRNPLIRNMCVRYLLTL